MNNNQTNLISLLTSSSTDQLYIDYLKHFYSYLPIDYLKIFTVEDLRIFSKHSYEFIRNLTTNRKTEAFEINPGKAFTIINIIDENKPFIVDSIKCLLAEYNLSYDFLIHPVISVVRDDKGNLLKIDGGNKTESIICIMIPAQLNSAFLSKLQEDILAILAKIDTTFEAWASLITKIDKTINTVEECPPTIDTNEILETKNFLNWLKNDNFTFLGSFDFTTPSAPFENILGDQSIWSANISDIQNIISLTCVAENKQLLDFGKINKLSPIHKSNFIDFILVKNFDLKGNIAGGTIFLGLYSSNLNYQSVKDIPIIRHKFDYVIEQSKFASNCYNSKKLRLVVESLPHAALFHIPNNELYNICLNTLSAMSTGGIKLFLPNDCSQNFVELVIFLPKVKLTPEVHARIHKFLLDKFNTQITREYITEVHQDYNFLYVTFASNFCFINKNEHELLEKEINTIATFWSDSLKTTCEEVFNLGQGNVLFSKYVNLFPKDYQYKFAPTEAVKDITLIEKLIVKENKIFSLNETTTTELTLKIFSLGHKLSLSETMPLLENLGYKVEEEQTFHLLSEQHDIWLHYYTLIPQAEMPSLAKVKFNIEETLENIANGNTIADKLCKLISFTNLTWREVSLLRALTAYAHQTVINYDNDYVNEVLVKHTSFSREIIELFKLKFSPAVSNLESTEILIKNLKEYLVGVPSSSEDKILRTILSLIEAMVRTNFYQKTEDTNKSYISFKFNSSLVPDLPQPIPFAEIFVHAAEFEGIHLRGTKVSRGGLRWSDRGEDYRTEVLGLMKAQMTKNSVIVPSGSKGGFFLKFSQDGFSRDQYMAKVIGCYKNFLRGLLDITDNLVAGQIIKPSNTVIYDEDDYYLVAAADKGTATFSDYANSISQEYNFWLGDAFASGGSAGYDHKKMGITAKGAWISVQRHFKELSVDVQKDPFTVVGIGDMSGDVFGNGMLLSKTIKLVAAFNHMHIFLDPDPDPAISFEEREILFNTPGSKWSDYDPKKISAGGGVFERKAKSIKLSPEVRQRLDINQGEITPENLIKAILKANVDLIWNGGIGTYIKSSTEEHYAVGDKTNDNVRVNGCEVRAKVIGEGGNLGVSQKGRIEYARQGGKINTDFIDNSAGVDCSDHEVNIKIALGLACASEKLSLEERNKFLAQMTDNVAELVLEDNINQTLALTIMENSPAFTIESFSRLIEVLEEEKLLNRKVEFIPSEAELAQKALHNEKLTRPELSVLLSYSKRSVYRELQDSRLAEDPYFEKMLVNYFPISMQQNFKSEILAHPLRKEIIFTEITNKLINQLSGPVLSSIKRETGALLCDLVRGFMIVQEIFKLEELWGEVEKLPSSVPLEVIIEMLTDINKVIRRGITWMINNLEHPLHIQQNINAYIESASKITKNIRPNLQGSAKERLENKYQKYIDCGIPSNLAEKCSSLDALISVFDIILISKDTGALPEQICHTYFYIGHSLNIDYLRKACDKLMGNSYWQRLSLQSLKDDLYDKQRRIIKKIIEAGEIETPDAWLIKNERYTSIFNNFVDNLALQENIDLSKIIIVNKKFEMFLRKV